MERSPYAQKKSGRIHRNSQHAPLCSYGGVIFGPKPKDWSIKMNCKEKRLAISSAIASAIVDEDALVVVEDGFTEELGKMGRPKTREFVKAMRRWGLDPKDKSMFLTMEVPDNVRLSCRNIGTVKTLTPRTLNLFDILDAEKLVFTKTAMDYLNAMYGENADFDNEDDDDDEVIEKGKSSISIQISGSSGSVSTVENHNKNANPFSVHPFPSVILSHQKPPNISETTIASSNISASSSSKEDTGNYYPGKKVKRRKRHRRKHYEDQEPCIMRGVYFKNMKWQAAIKVDQKQIHLGTVGSQEEAARLYDRSDYISFLCPGTSSDKKRVVGPSRRSIASYGFYYWKFIWSSKTESKAKS